MKPEVAFLTKPLDIEWVGIVVMVCLWPAGAPADIALLVRDYLAGSDSLS